MKYLLLIIALSWNGADISQTNSLKKEALDLYVSGRYDLAEQKLVFLKDSLGVSSPEIGLNLASAQFNQGKTEEAFFNYKEVASSKNNEYASQALLQMGVISHDQQKLEEALNAFRESLIRDPGNKESRYNYELVKKKLEQQQDQEQQEDQDKQDQQDQENKNKDQQDQEKDQEQENEQDQQQQEEDQEQGENQEQDRKEGDQDQEDQQQQEGEEQNAEEEQQEQPKPGEEGDEKEQQQNAPTKSQPDFNEVKISPEMAKMILQAMENREMQYFQQLKKEPTKSSKSKSKW